MRIRHRASVPLASALAVGILWSCGIYDASLLLPAPDAAPPLPADVDADSGCERATWPRRPQIDDVPGGGSVSFVVAARSADFGLGRDGGIPRDFGFDLDGVCTCPLPERPGSCRLPADFEPTCDLDQGRDNSTTHILETFTTLSDAFSQEQVNGALRAGTYGLLMRIRNYNGTANDPNVEVAAFNSAGMPPGSDGGSPTPPRYDGNDAWMVNPESLKGGVGPPDTPDYVPEYVDVNAYVSDHRLVATIDFPLTFGGSSSVTVDLKGSVVVGTLVPEGDSFRIENGIVTGRWPVARLLSSLEVVPDALDSTRYLCGDSPSYGFVKALVCAGQDIVSDGKQDNTGAPCDAVSFTMGFTSSPAKLGQVVAPPKPPKPCGPAWSDDCTR